MLPGWLTGLAADSKNRKYSKSNTIGKCCYKNNGKG